MQIPLLVSCNSNGVNKGGKHPGIGDQAGFEELVCKCKLAYLSAMSRT